mgnify:CR=1 FL=1
MHDLLESTVLDEPMAQLQRWWKTAEQQGLTLAEGMVLATVGPDGRPSARVVLLKHLDQAGLVFYTNYSSRKAAELDAHPAASVVFWWPELERQVRVEGQVEKVDAATSDAYFASRPRGSRISAWASPQSQVVPDRPTLDGMAEAAETRFATGDVPRPPFWGGYRLRPEIVEFWQGRARRLHDRLRYRRSADGTWSLERLAP